MRERRRRLAHPHRENGFEIVGRCRRAGYFVERLLRCDVVFIEDLRQGGRVGSDALQIGCCLRIIAACNIKIADHGAVILGCYGAS